MRLLDLLESSHREVLEFQQELIERLPDCFDISLEGSHSGKSYGIRISYDDRLVALLSFGSLRPFNVTCELISKMPDRDPSGFSAWTDHEGFMKHLTRALA